MKIMLTLIDVVGPVEGRLELIERTADYFSGSFGSPDSASDTVLMEMIELLLARGVVLPPRDTSCMQNAARSSPEVIDFLLSKGVHIDARTPGERPALHELLSWRYDREAVLPRLEFLFERGADPNARGYEEETACFVVRNEKDLLSFLVAHGADLNLTNHHGMTPLFDLLVNRIYWEDPDPTQGSFAEWADMARHMIHLGADPAKCVEAEGLDPYRWLMHTTLQYSGVPAKITPEWLALVAELGVPIDTESPLPPPGPRSPDADADAPEVTGSEQ